MTLVADRRVWTVEEIREKVATGDRWWVARAILAIYSRQTDDEQRTEATLVHNKIGFSGRDGNLMSSFAKQILHWQGLPVKRYDFPLSARQLSKARERMPSYARQLAEIANAG